MCSKEEVKAIVDASEAKMEAKLQQSHQAIAKTISNLMGDEQEERKETKAMIAKILEQTTKTNGRVSALETWKAVHQTENGTLTKKLDDVCTTLQRLNWLLISGVVVAVLNLVLR
jgi:uncharacterized protein YwgA